MPEPAKKQREEQDLEKILTHPAFKEVGDLVSSKPDEFYTSMKLIEKGYTAMEEQVEKLQKSLEEEKSKSDRYKKEMDRLKPLAFVDSLTGAYNHRYFMDQLETEVKESNRYQNPLSLCMVDIDHFKKFNDTHGHQAGDYVLKCLTGIAKEALRETDIFARYGGEEFVVIMTNTDEKEAEEAAERLRKAVEDAHLDYHGQKLNFTISAGVASHKPSKESSDDFITSADQPLYAAKDLGRNCVVSRNLAEKDMGIDLSIYSSEKAKSL